VYIPLTKRDKKNIETLRAAYDVRYSIDEFFKDAYNSI
jgi:hypothetical protein